MAFLEHHFLVLRQDTMNEETLVKVDSLVLEKGNMTIMAGNMAAGRQAVTPEHELRTYTSCTGWRRGGERRRPGLLRAQMMLQGHPSDKPSARLLLQILPKLPPAANHYCF